MNEFDSLEDAIRSACGGQAVIDKSITVSGGDINEAYLLMLSDGSRLFVKMNRRENVDFFRAELSGLAWCSLYLTIDPGQDLTIVFGVVFYDRCLTRACTRGENDIIRHMLDRAWYYVRGIGIVRPDRQQIPVGNGQ